MVTILFIICVLNNTVFSSYKIYVLIIIQNMPSKDVNITDKSIEAEDPCNEVLPDLLDDLSTDGTISHCKQCPL